MNCECFFALYIRLTVAPLEFVCECECEASLVGAYVSTWVLWVSCSIRYMADSIEKFGLSPLPRMIERKRARVL